MTTLAAEGARIVRGAHLTTAQKATERALMELATTLEYIREGQVLAAIGGWQCAQRKLADAETAMAALTLAERYSTEGR